MQEFVPKILEIITTNWDSDVHIAGLRLLNELQVPDNMHALLRKLMPSLMEILQMGNTLAQVQGFLYHPPPTHNPSAFEEFRKKP